MNAELIQLLDTVALARDLPDMGLRRGQVGAVVEVFSAGGLEVEFVDSTGQTYGLHTLSAEDLIVLKYEPQRIAS